MAKSVLDFEELLDVFDELESVADTSKRIAVAAEFAGRARVLEYGSVAGQRPWPQPGERTIPAVDPESGAQVVVSAKAPQGFIRLHIREFIEQFTDNLSQPADWLDAKQTQEHVAQATSLAAEQAIDVIRREIPQDSGDLAASLQIIE